MVWLPTQRHLHVPSQPGAIDPASPLAWELSSLWVPAIGQSDNGLINFAPNYVIGMEHFTGSAAPTILPTEYGIGQKYDGSNDLTMKVGNIPFQPQSNILNTIAAVFRVDAIPTSPAGGQVYGFTNINNFDGRALLDFSSDRVRFWFSGNGGTNANFAQVNDAFSAGEVMFVTVCTDSYTTTRISVWEPRTGRYFSSINTAGTSTPAILSNFPMGRETIGGRFYGNFADNFLSCTVSDIWMWRRSFSEDELDLWRQNRWSVFQPDRSKTAYFYSQKASVPKTTFLTASQFIPSAPLVIPSAIVPSKLFVASSALTTGSVTIIRNATPEPGYFESSAGLTTIGVSFGQNFATPPTILTASSSLISGEVTAVQSVDLAGYDFNEVGSLVPGSVSAARAADVAGATLTANATLLNGFAGAQMASTVDGATLLTAGSLIVGTPVAQRNTTAPGDILVASSILLRGTLSFGLAGMTREASTSLIAGVAQAQRAIQTPGQTLVASAALSVADPAVAIDPKPLSVTAPSRTVATSSTLLAGVARIGLGAIITPATQQASVEFLPSVPLAQSKATIPGMTKAATATLLAGQPIIIKRAAVQSQTLSTKATLLPGTAIASKPASVAGASLVASVSFTPGIMAGVRNVKAAGFTFSSVSDLTSGNVTTERGVSFGGGLLTVSAMFLPGRPAAQKSADVVGVIITNFASSVFGQPSISMVKPPTGQINVSLGVRSAAIASLQTR